MRRVMSASRRVRKTGAVPVLGLTRAKSDAARGKQRIRVVDGGGVVQEEGTLGLGETALLAAENEGAEFETGVDIGEKRRQIGSQPAVLKVEQTANASAGGDRLEKARGGLVGVDAGRCQQSHDAVRLDQVHGALDEERVKVYPAAAEQRILA